MNKTLLFSVVLLAVFASTAFATSKHDIEIVINMGPKHDKAPVNVSNETAPVANDTNITIVAPKKDDKHHMVEKKHDKKNETNVTVEEPKKKEDEHEHKHPMMENMTNITIIHKEHPMKKDDEDKKKKDPMMKNMTNITIIMGNKTDKHHDEKKPEEEHKKNETKKNETKEHKPEEHKKDNKTEEHKPKEEKHTSP